MKKSSLKVFFCLSSLFGGILYSSDKAPLVNINERNKQADTAFIQWKLDAPYSSISAELRTYLTPHVQTFLVDEAQIPFTRQVSKKELLAKVDMVRSQILKKFPVKNNLKLPISELDELIKEVIIPEYTFLGDSISSSDPLSESYNALLGTLRRYTTAAGTSLDLWALRFLTSEAQLVALAIIKKETSDGKTFNELDVAGKLEILFKVREIVVRRFIHNLKAIQQHFDFPLPSHSYMAVAEKIDRFLNEKFGIL